MGKDKGKEDVAVGKRKVERPTGEGLSKKSKMATKSVEEVFHEKFAARDVYHGRFIDFESLLQGKKSDIVDLFREQGWYDLLKEKDVPVYPQLVRSFYGYMDIEKVEDGVLTTQVNGKQITITPEYLGEVLGVPSDGVWDYPNNKWSTHTEFDKNAAIRLVLGEVDGEDVIVTKKPAAADLAMNVRFLHLILMQTVVGRSGNKNSFTFVDCFVVYFLLKKVKINLPRIMMHYMAAVVKKVREEGRQLLPYGMWLTKVFQRELEDLSDEEKTPCKHTALSIATITDNMGCDVDEHGEVVEKEGLDEAVAIKPRKGKQVKATISSPDLSVAILENMISQEMLRRAYPEIFNEDGMKEVMGLAKKRLAEINGTGADGESSSRKPGAEADSRVEETANRSNSDGN